MVSVATNLLYAMGYAELSINMPLLTAMQGFQFFSLYVGLILTVILAILFLLSTMLIYSLLIVSIESRVFQIGVHRMVGMTRAGVIKMLLVQGQCPYTRSAAAQGLCLLQAFVLFPPLPSPPRVYIIT